MSTENPIFLPNVPYAASERKRILLAEDNPHLLHFIELILIEANFEVCSCTNGLTAKKLFDQSPRPFDLLITDNDMPNINGLTLGKLLKREAPTLPIIFMSALDIGSLIKERFAQFQNVHFLAKPFESKDLLTVIASLMEQSQQSKRMSA